MERIRLPLQGVGNIIRFNWHFYVFAFAIALSLALLYPLLDGLPALTIKVLGFAIFATTVSSLLVSYYIYDFSALYELNWMPVISDADQKTIINIHAGFDETSHLLVAKYPNAPLLVYDFYNPALHTEVSIRRASKAYPPFPGTVSIGTNHLPLSDHTAYYILVMLAAHEIRNKEERVLFFRELKRALDCDGQIIVVEHLRDLPNFLAYTFGFFHFLSRQEWYSTFKQSELHVAEEVKITPFITAFFLKKDGITT